MHAWCDTETGISFTALGNQVKCMQGNWSRIVLACSRLNFGLTVFEWLEVPSRLGALAFVLIYTC